MKFTLYTGIVVLVAPLLTGCVCTRFTQHQIGFEYYDKFYPSEVYRREDPLSFALGGTREKNGNAYQAFLIVPDDLLAAAHLQTNQTLAVEDIQKIYNQSHIIFQKTPRRVPPDYVRVAVLPKNEGIEVQGHQPGWGWQFLVPFAVVVDIVTFPLQAIICACGGIRIPM